MNWKTKLAITTISLSSNCYAQFGGMLAPPVDILQGTAFITQNDIIRQQQLADMRAERGHANQAGAAGKERQSQSTAERATSPHTVAPRRRNQSSVPNQLAATYPASKRAEVERVFTEMLAAHRKIEDRFGIAPNDVAGAVAVFVAGSYMAYRNSPFPDENFPPLVQQMREVLRDNPAFLRASGQTRQDTYDQLAILGMFMAATQMALQRQPDHAMESGMRERGKEYLERFLRTDADRVQINARGLVLK